MGVLAIGALCVLASAVVLYRRWCLLADREAERAWFTEERAWWEALRAER